MKADTNKLFTIDHFKLALFDLLSKEDIDNIGINDLCRRAGYSKQTFYRYFENKTDFINQLISDEIVLYQEIIEQTVKSFGGSIRTDEDIKKIRMATFNHIYKRRIYYKNLFKYACFRDFRIALVEFLKQNDKLPIFTFANNAVSDIDYLNYVCSYFHYGTIDFWVNENFAHSVEEIVDIFYQTLKGIGFVSLNALGINYDNIHKNRC